MKRALLLLSALIALLGLNNVMAEERPDFLLDQTYVSETEGTIHYNIFVPDDYDGSRPFALHLALPGWEGLYFQGVGADLRREALPYESSRYVKDLIVVSAQLDDWGMTSARQAVALTEHLLEAYNIDPDRVYITGYSGGGETLSLVMELRPELYAAALFVSSQWDGDPAPLVAAQTPLYLFTAEHDSYYGSEPVEQAYQRIHDLYIEAGFSEEEIASLLVMDIRGDGELDAMYAVHAGPTGAASDIDYHGAGMLAAFDADVMNWVFKNDPAEAEQVNWNENTGIQEVISYPGFGDWGRLIFPVDSSYFSGSTLGSLGLTWYSNIRPGKTVEIVNYMKEKADAGEKIFYRIYTDEEIAADPWKADTGLFFFRGNPGAKFAVCNAGGGFAYVGAMHDSFPHALELSKKGYNAFALIYRPGVQTACEDLARAIAFIHAHADELEVDVTAYSLWGGSAGARMAAWLGSYGTAAFGEPEYPWPAAVIMQYTGLGEVYGNEPPTYNCVGDNDGIASWRTMERRVAAIQANGTDAMIEVFPGLSHGFGLGTGTVAKGWIDNAVAFWERNMD